MMKPVYGHFEGENWTVSEKLGPNEQEKFQRDG